MPASGQDRRRWVVLGACAVAAVLLLVLGAAAPGRGDRGSGWQGRLSGVGAGPLHAGDFRARSGGCTIQLDRVSLTGGCVLHLEPSGGRFSLGPATRRALVTAQGSPVRLAVVLDGHELGQRVNPGDAPVRLTFGRDGGTLVLSCLAPTGCTVVFTQEKT